MIGSLAVLTVGCLIAFTAIAPSPAIQTAAAQSPRPAATPVDVRGEIKTTSEKRTIDRVLTGAQIVGGLIALLTFPIIAQQLVASRIATRQQRTAELQVVWTDREFRTILSRVYSFIGAPSMDERLGKIRSWARATHSEERTLLVSGAESGVDADRKPPCKNDVYHVLDVIESLSLRYNEREVNRRWVALTLGPTMIGLLHETLWLVHVIRRYPDELPGVYCEWSLMVRDLRSPPPRRWPGLASPVKDLRAIVGCLWQRRPHPVFEGLRQPVGEQPIRIMCLPPNAATASDEDWRRASYLSTALSHERAQDALCTRPVAEPCTACRWTVIVVPRSIDAEGQQIADDAGLAERLTERLGTLDSAAIDETIAFLRNVS